MEINIICIGKIKEEFIVKGINEYLKRVKPFANVKIIELKEHTFNDSVKNLKEESKLILNLIAKDDYLVTLEIEGKQFDSVEFASFISNHFTYNSKPINFVIGSSDGISQEVKDRSNYKMSISKMTFPHQLMRLILLEQIYRAMMINNNNKYHK